VHPISNTLKASVQRTKSVRKAIFNIGHLSKQKNYNKYVDGIDAGIGNYRAFETMQDKTDDEWVETCI
jgi:hypothetical protein